MNGSIPEWDIVLVHAAADEAAAVKLHKRLTEARATVFLACLRLQPGDDVAREMAHALDGGGIVVPLLSAAFQGDLAARGLLHEALARRRNDGTRPVAPVLLGGKKGGHAEDIDAHLERLGPERQRRQHHISAVAAADDADAFGSRSEVSASTGSFRSGSGTFDA